MKFSGAEIVQTLQLPEEAIFSKGDLVECNIHTDSRSIAADHFFWALPGDQFHGDQFVAQCLQDGSHGAVFSKVDESVMMDFRNHRWLIRVADTLDAYQRIGKSSRYKSMAKIVGITGSNGKTTTKEMCQHLLSKKYKTIASPKSFNNHVGVPHTLLLLEKDTDICVLEIGMNHAGEIFKLAQLASPDVGVVLNVSRAHLGNFNDLTEIADSKAELMHHIPEDSGVLVLNAELKSFKVFQNLKHKHIFWFGKQGDYLDLKLIDAQHTDSGLKFHFEDKEGIFEIGFEGIGCHLAENVAASFLVAKHFGLQKEEIIEFFKDFHLPKMRMEKINMANHVTFINDAYNANPTSAKLAVDAFLQMHIQGRRHLVFGSMEELGRESETCHLELAQHIKRQSIDFVYVFGEKSQVMLPILNENKCMHTEFFESHEAIGLALIRNIKEHDAVLLKGSRKNTLENVIACLQKEERF